VVGTQNRPDVLAASQNVNPGACCVAMARSTLRARSPGTACVCAPARTAPMPAGAPTRRGGDGAPLVGVVEFPEADPPDQPAR